MKASNLLILVWLSVANNAFAGTVRTAYVSNSTMVPIYLKLGKSTVIRFNEKPKKVVVGNQNYYGLEFIENDVAVQPLGSVGTNLFVYTANRTYGFLLTPSEKYDDLVFAKWANTANDSRREPVDQSRSSAPNVSFRIGQDLLANVVKIQGPSTFGLHIIDTTLENRSKREINLVDFKLVAKRSGKLFENQSVVIDRDKLKPMEKAKVRLVMKLNQREGFTLEGKIESSTGKVIIDRKYL